MSCPVLIHLLGKVHQIQLTVVEGIEFLDVLLLDLELFFGQLRLQEVLSCHGGSSTRSDH